MTRHQPLAPLRVRRQHYHAASVQQRTKPNWKPRFAHSHRHRSRCSPSFRASRASAAWPRAKSAKSALVRRTEISTRSRSIARSSASQELNRSTGMTPRGMPSGDRRRRCGRNASVTRVEKRPARARCTCTRFSPRPQGPRCRSDSACPRSGSLRRRNEADSY